MATWINADGLELKFGTDRAKLDPVGEHKFDGPRRLVEIQLNTTTAPTVADGLKVISEGVVLPRGAVVESVEIFAHVDVTSDNSNSALVDVGIMDLDRSTSDDAPQALVNAATLTEINTGGTNVVGWAGSTIGGAALTEPKLLTWSVAANGGATRLTAGSAVIRIFYSVA